MNRTQIPDWVRDRVIDRRGKFHVFDDMAPARSALVAVDMQNGFLMDGVAHAVIAQARDIVPEINRLAAALRELGGLVVWVRTAATEESFKSWSIAYEKLAKPARAQKRIAALTPGSLGYRFWAEMDIQADDLIIDKTRFSAFIQGSSAIELNLRARGIDTLLIAGTATNVCCESTARDAAMRNFQTVMVSDALAAKTDEEHNAALMNFALNFGDVMTTDEAIGYLRTNGAARAAEER